MPYRVDISPAREDALDLLVELGALDVVSSDDAIAAILPDSVTPETIRKAIGGSVTISPAAGRDDGSVWLIHQCAVQVGDLRIAPAQLESPGVLRLADSCAFGTGHHPTTALCLEAIQEVVAAEKPRAMLDIGTGSGILAVAALMLGVPRATGIDIDADALTAAAENARLNHVAERLELLPGGPESLEGQWPLIVANVLAAPLIEMAPTVVRRVAPGGILILSGIPRSLEGEVRQAYQDMGLQPVGSAARGGWVALTARASW